MEPSRDGVTTSMDADIACVSCGYNLRGLRGKLCPECGSEIAPSLAAYEIGRRLPGLAALPRRTMRELRCGACLVLLGWAVQVAAPWWSGLIRGYVTIDDRLLLYVICVAWTVQFWGLWMLATPLKGVGESAHRPRRSRWIGGLILLATLTPGWIFFDYAIHRMWGWHPGTLGNVMTIAGALSNVLTTPGMLACAFCITHCQVCAARCATLERRTWLAGAAWILAVIHGLAYVAMILLAGSSWGFYRPLEALTMLPNPLGSPVVVHAFWDDVLNRFSTWPRPTDSEELILLGYTLLQLGSAFVLGATTVLLFRARARSES